MTNDLNNFGIFDQEKNLEISRRIGVGYEKLTIYIDIVLNGAKGCC